MCIAFFISDSLQTPSENQFTDNKMGTCQTNPKILEEKVEIKRRERPKPDPKAYLMSIVKIQAYFKGYLARKGCFKARLGGYNNRILENLNNYGHNYNYMLGNRLPLYNYTYEKDHEDPYFEYREFRPATQLASGGVYKGEW